MALKVACIGQKGGGGKSTTSRTTAVSYAYAGWEVKICDFDIGQGTCTDWNRQRLQNSFQPTISVASYRTVEQALKTEDSYNLLVFDGPPAARSITLSIAKSSDVIILPCGVSRDDLKPTVILAHDLVNDGISSDKIAFVFTRTSDSESEIIQARDYVKKAGYIALESTLPDKTTYRTCNDRGLAVTESSHPSLKLKAEKFTQGIVDFINHVTNQETSNAIKSEDSTTPATFTEA